MHAAFTGLQLLDGFDTTADHRRGLIPQYVESAGFVDVGRLRRLRTIGGSFEIHRAVKR